MNFLPSVVLDYVQSTMAGEEKTPTLTLETLCCCGIPYGSRKRKLDVDVSIVLRGIKDFLLDERTCGLGDTDHACLAETSFPILPH